MTPRFLDGVTVVESGASLAVAFAGRLLRSLGATVLRVPDGEFPLRPGPVADALRACLAQGKEERLALDDAPGDFLAGAHAWLDGRAARAILGDPFSAAHAEGLLRPDLTHVAVTPWGLDGPWRDEPASPLALAAVAGFLALCGEPEREPLRNGGHLPDFQAGLFAALAAVAGIYAVEQGAPGRFVDVSLLECIIAFQERGDLAVTHLGVDLVRSRRHEGTHPFMVLPCKDGFVTLAVGTPRQWQNLCLLIGRPEWADDPEMLVNRLAHWREIDEALLPWLAQHTPMEVTRVCQELLIAAGPVLTADEVLADVHLLERDFFDAFEGWRVPGLPLRVEGARLRAGSAT